MTTLSHMEIIQKIAKQTELSTSSVYKILQNPFDFSPDTANRVIKLADEYGYHMAKRSKTLLRIGVLIPSRPSYYWREAMKGMKDAQHDIKQTEKEPIELCFSYLHFKLGDEALGIFYSEAIKSHADGFIIFPAPLSECNRFIVKKGRTHPVILFNECHSELLLKHFPDVNELNHPNIASVSSDNMDEGRVAFNLIRPRLNEMNHYVYITLRGDLEKTPITSSLRMESFRGELLDVKPDARIDYINIDFASKITSSYLSQKLYDIQLRDPIDCIYITTGATHLACVAIEKLNERFGKNLQIFCFGHECSPSDRKYIERGMQLGYVKQDVYQQGYDAVMMLYRHLMDGTALEDKLYHSICVKPNN